jgi:DNA-binding NarL/FixJ family response regulator
LEVVLELFKEGLSVKQIAKILKLPVELIHQQVQKLEKDDGSSG